MVVDMAMLARMVVVVRLLPPMVVVSLVGAKVEDLVLGAKVVSLVGAKVEDMVLGAKVADIVVVAKVAIMVESKVVLAVKGAITVQEVGLWVMDRDRVGRVPPTQSPSLVSCTPLSSGMRGAGSVLFLILGVTLSTFTRVTGLTMPQAAQDLLL